MSYRNNQAETFGPNHVEMVESNALKSSGKHKAGSMSKPYSQKYHFLADIAKK